MNRFFLTALFLLIVALGVAAQSDDLDRVADEAARRAAAGGLAAGERVVVAYYYIAKYRASATQRSAAVQRARKISKKLQSKDRYLAVPTTQDSRSKSAVSVMVWDTQSQEIVGNNVYDLNTVPADRSSVRLDDVKATFVSSH
jgi:hypothetical protein